jgi:hypothetical protein
MPLSIKGNNTDDGEPNFSFRLEADGDHTIFFYAEDQKTGEEYWISKIELEDSTITIQDDADILKQFGIKRIKALS